MMSVYPSELWLRYISRIFKDRIGFKVRCHPYNLCQSMTCIDLYDIQCTAASSVASAGGKGLRGVSKRSWALVSALASVSISQASPSFGLFSQWSWPRSRRVEWLWTMDFGLTLDQKSSEVFRVVETCFKVMNCKCTRHRSRSALVAFAFALSPLSLATDRNIFPFRKAKHCSKTPQTIIDCNCEANTCINMARTVCHAKVLCKGAMQTISRIKDALAIDLAFGK